MMAIDRLELIARIMFDPDCDVAAEAATPRSIGRDASSIYGCSPKRNTGAFPRRCSRV
jgi:hypothetical protein